MIERAHTCIGNEIGATFDSTTVERITDGADYTTDGLSQCDRKPNVHKTVECVDFAVFTRNFA